MHLRLLDRAGFTGFADHLPAGHLVAALDQEFVVVGIGGDPAVVVADQNKIAIAFEFAAGIGDDPAFGGVHFGAERNRHVDAVVMRAIGTAAKSGDDFASHGPTQFAAVASRGRDSRDFSSTYATSATWKQLFKLKIEYLPVVGIPTKVLHRHAKVIGPGGVVIIEDESYISLGGWIRSGKLSQLFAEQSCGSLDRWPDESSWIVFGDVGTR